MIPLIRLEQPIEAYNAIEEVLCSGQFIGGEKVAEFEQKWASYIGTKYCIGCGSGTIAIASMLQAAGVIGIRVVPDNHMTRAGLRLGGIGADWHSTLAVHLGGIPTPGGTFEDCCQAHGARLNGRMCGSLGKAAAWSFYPTKNLGAMGDAGAITTDDEVIADRLRAMPWMRMDSIQAAVLTAKLPYLEKWNARRRQIAEYYLKNLKNVSLPVVPDGAEPCWHLFQVGGAFGLRAKLARVGIESKYHVPWALSIPVGPHLTDTEVDAIVERVNE